MAWTVAEVKRAMKRYDPEVRRTASGTEVVLRLCPLDLKNKGDLHPQRKFYINPSKGTARCFYCHPQGNGISLSRLIRKRRTRSRASKQSEPETARPLPPLPRNERICDIDDLLHPAWLYLNGQRNISADAVCAADLRWKAADVPAWEKQNPRTGVWEPKCDMPGVVIPIRVHGRLMGWQLCPVPRISDKMKYITAPGSSFPLYNFDNVVENGARVCVVFEGVFDVLTLPRIAVGIFTDKINKRKRRLLSTGGFEEIVLCMDSDRSDEHINEHWAKILHCAPVVRAVRLSEGDPNDHRPDALLDALGLKGRKLFR